jgi:hypothetical protein
VRPGKLLTPSHRFGFAIEGCKELLDCWDELYDFASQNPPKVYEQNGDHYYKPMLEELALPVSKARVAIVYEITKDLEPLIAYSEANPTTQIPDLWPKFDAFRARIETVHGETEMFLDNTLALYEVDLTDAEFAQMKKATELSAEIADATVLRHLLVKNKKDAAKKSAKERSEIIIDYADILKRRDRWAVPNFAKFPPDATGADHQQLLKCMIGSAPTYPFCEQYNGFMRQTSRAGESTLPLALAADPVKFWRQMAVLALFPLVTKAALSALSIPYSSAAVERTFSQMSSLETKSRLLAGDRYVRNMLFFSCNRAHLQPHLASKITGLFPELLPGD